MGSGYRLAATFEMPRMDGYALATYMKGTSAPEIGAES